MASKLPGLPVARSRDFSFANNDIHLPVLLIGILYEGSFFANIRVIYGFIMIKILSGKKSCKN